RGRWRPRTPHQQCIRELHRRAAPCRAARPRCRGLVWSRRPRRARPWRTRSPQRRARPMAYPPAAAPPVATPVLATDLVRPTLAGTPCSAANAAHVFLDGPLADLDPELEQLAADALGAPQASPRRHVADEVDRLGWQWRRLPRPRSPPPEQAEASTMPAQNGL